LGKMVAQALACDWSFYISEGNVFTLQRLGVTERTPL
jgi:hypothetical protein